MTPRMTTPGDLPDAPQCLPPRPARPPDTFRPAPGSWDTHCHVIDGGPEMPFVPNRGYTPNPADPDAYVSMLDVVGLTYGVVTQISVHGHDNRLIADALRRYPHRLRGVVSIEGSEPDEHLHALRDLGVCGIRLNEHFSGGSGADRLQQIAQRCRPLGWHLDLGLPGARLRELATELLGLDIPLVIDHMGACPAALGVRHPDFEAVLRLAASENCWVKLSGGYRFTGERSPYSDTAPFIRALCEVAPTRTVWGSDWPNVAVFSAEKLPETGGQLDALKHHLQPPEQLKAVLVDNPARLYGRPGTAVAAPMADGR